ncbi:polyhydroxyalkanoate synthesis repressor PhaR [Xanthobacter tagetidis]|jgi:polyhydroxyalkanoate synthesis repressor PhaR|uniref:Polyhydroxyalkanoate synthesis repressor PhaR n=1 Tax=Xanthobacter tagetidis TaxID=60216 RepID=A0A3L7AM80_9HYPH|nr:polyhydroxyalkanoate synthesis repressor PhaR [Xanthobacter tagetidis]MBB6307967.1 polyhydroxyalkanoate synthesis repressor PhaR [Xanthobacter tagetidis]RLP81613.1 polyhydroxyalkanoate synthesis repressor PhaR [Xanthobacter tagetidis]
MAKSQEPVTIKKYANRRLYNTGTSTYVTLEDLANMVKDGEDFVVYDAKNGDDITHSVLTQIIFEQENKGQNLLPITFLRQIIRFYGDSMQMLVPRYLEASIDSFTKDQEKFRDHVTKTLTGTAPFVGLDDHVRRNMEMFERAFHMFLPFPKTEGGEGVPATGAGPAAASPAPAPAPEPRPDEFDAIRRQMAEMQAKLDQLIKKPESGDGEEGSSQP